MMNVLLIYPEFPDTFWSFKHAIRFIRKRASLPPLGLLTIAAILPKTWNKRLIDTNVRRLRPRDLQGVDLVMLSAMTVQRDSARNILDLCRAVGVRVVAGGPLFTTEFQDFPDVDHLVLNEAEVTLPQFLQDFSLGKARRIYKADEYADMSTSPVPLWEIAELNRYASVNIQFTRGCPFQCEFCNVTALFGHVPRWKSTRQILAELDVLYSLGWRDGIFFVDDNFIGNRRYLKDDLLPALVRWRRGKSRVSFFTEASIDLADDESLARQMVRAGFDQVFIGIETPDDGSLTECLKKQNQGRDMLADVKKLQRWGLQVQGGFIVGFDGDSESVFQRQIDFIQGSGIVTAMVGLLQALPGTRLYDRMSREGRLLGRASGDNVDGSTNIVPNMGMEALREGYRDLMRQIYSPTQYYRRLKIFLAEYKPQGRMTLPTIRDIRAFVRSIFRLGICGKERFQYWNLVISTGFRRPNLLSVAVTLAIHGYHFRRVCDLHVH